MLVANPKQNHLLDALLKAEYDRLSPDFSPYDSNEMSRKACKTLGNLTGTLESATAIIKVPTVKNNLIIS